MILCDTVEMKTSQLEQPLLGSNVFGVMNSIIKSPRTSNPLSSSLHGFHIAYCSILAGCLQAGFAGARVNDLIIRAQMC